ncbi:MAG TPA: pseudouridine synthase [Bacteroidota bacterium]|jgi:pseudouridine synthase
MNAKKGAVRAVSLARALSKLGYTSRSRAAELIRSGRVSLNGRIVRNPSARCSPGEDRFLVDGSILPRKRIVTVLMNKPEGVVTTRSDERSRPTVYDVLGDEGRWLFPVGRLDKDTSGMLLLTNDNRLGERLTNPRSKIPKTYRVSLDRPPSDTDLEMFEKGMSINGEKLLPAAVSRESGTILELTILEGKNRQIRRMCEQLGYAIVSLMRVKMGGLGLGALKKGEWRYLTAREVELLSRPAQE